MYTTQAPFNFATFDDVAFKLGVRQSMVGYFSGWDKPFRADAVTRAWERGLMPLLTWESTPSAAGNDEPVQPDYTLAKIIGGEFDEYLHQYARDITATGLPLAIRLDHEMNGSWYPWSEMRNDGSSLNTNSRGEYVAMWRHVHDIFEEEGANDLVVWIWAPNVINNLAPTLKDPAYLASLYPGDEYVDWIGLSGYLRPTTNPQNRSFTYTFDPSLAQLRAITDKPIFLAEVGATENDGRKPEWVTSFFDAFADPENDDIIGFAWFNIAVTTISGDSRVTNDWRVDSRSDSLAAFREGLTDPAAGFALKPY
ncbi:MAG: beta-mannanase [Microbacterium sp.]|nr:MAG: beta-mannanase [Microbacterium sp.]